MRQRKRERESERHVLIGRTEGVGFFQERDDRWKERLRRDEEEKKKVEKTRLKTLTSRGREGRTSQNATETPLTCNQV